MLFRDCFLVWMLLFTFMLIPAFVLSVRRTDTTVRGALFLIATAAVLYTIVFIIGAIAFYPDMILGSVLLLWLCCAACLPGYIVIFVINLVKMRSARTRKVAKSDADATATEVATTTENDADVATDATAEGNATTATEPAQQPQPDRATAPRQPLTRNPKILLGITILFLVGPAVSLAVSVGRGLILTNTSDSLWFFTSEGNRSFGTYVDFGVAVKNGTCYQFDLYTTSTGRHLPGTITSRGELLSGTTGFGEAGFDFIETKNDDTLVLLQNDEILCEFNSGSYTNIRLYRVFVFG